MPYCLLAFLLITLSVFPGCTHGLEPIPVQPGFGGAIRFTSPWPPADSALDVRIVAFYDYPPQNIFGAITSGQAKVYPPIGPGSGFHIPTDSVAYTFTLDSPARFKYVVVALQYGSNITTDWKVVGAYGYLHGIGSPDSVIVGNTFIDGINIDVDFKNVPPTPGVSSAHRTAEQERIADPTLGRSQVR